MRRHCLLRLPCQPRTHRRSNRYTKTESALMPEHVHMLICPQRDDYSISNILLAIKRPASYRARKAGYCTAAHLWQPGGGYDRNLWTSETIHKEIDYMHANPVRKGFCEAPEQWLYSSAAYWAGMTDAPLKMDHSLPPRDASAGD